MMVVVLTRMVAEVKNGNSLMFSSLARQGLHTYSFQDYFVPDSTLQ